MFYKTPQLESERLILKKGSEEDFVKVYEYDFTKLREICGEFEFVKNDPKISALFATDSEKTENMYDWIIYLKESMEPIGNVFADSEIKELNSIEIGCNLHPNYWGNGYMKEAIVEVMRFLFKNGYNNIICGYDEGNNKSKRMQEKIGFEFYKKEPNSWVKNGTPITKYTNIMSEDTFNNLYGINEKTR